MKELAKGIVRGYDVSTGVVTAEIVGSHPYFVGVPAATHLTPALLEEGKLCAVLFFDDHNPEDGVVVATYDEPMGMSILIADGAAEADDAVTTTSTAYVDLPNMAVTVDLDYTCKVLLLFDAVGRNNTLHNSIYWVIADGEDNALTVEYLIQQEYANHLQHIGQHALVSAGVGQHTYKVRWRVNGGTGNVLGRKLTALVFTEG